MLTFHINTQNPIVIVTVPNYIVHRMVNRQIDKKPHDQTLQRIHSVQNKTKNHIKTNRITKKFK